MWTTLAVMETPGLVEANPVVRTAVHNFGGAGLAVLKLLVLVVGVLLSADIARTDDSWHLLPTLLAVVGTIVVAHNVGLLGLLDL